MSENSFGTNMNCSMKGSKQDDLLNLALVRQDRFAAILFLIGTLLALYSTYQAEQAIVQPEEKQTSNQNKTASTISPAELLVLFNAIFLIAAIILSSDALSRLKKQKTDISSNTSTTSINNFIGSELATLGSIVRVIGYTLSVVGNQIRSDNPIS